MDPAVREALAEFKEEWRQGQARERQAIENQLTQGVQAVLYAIEDVKDRVVSLGEDVGTVRVQVAAHMAESAAKEVAFQRQLDGHQRTLYGKKGDNGLQGDVALLKRDRRWVWSILGIVGTVALAALPFLLQWAAWRLGGG